jgi:hypothetical protein
VVNLQVGWLVGEVCAKPPSYVDDDTVEVTWRVMLVMVPLNHACDGAAKATLAVALPSQR